jgi:hypothetical protein
MRRKNRRHRRYIAEGIAAPAFWPFCVAAGIAALQQSACNFLRNILSLLVTKLILPYNEAADELSLATHSARPPEQVPAFRPRIAPGLVC